MSATAPIEPNKPRGPERPRRHHFTVEQYERIIQAGVFEEDRRLELLNGEIIEMPAVGSLHAAHVNHLTRIFVERIGDDAVIHVQNPVRLGDESELEPDISVLAPRDDLYASELPADDDVSLLVEVADTSLEYDRDDKLPVYARHGIPVVWLVNLREGVVEVFEQPNHEGGHYEALSTPESDARLPIPDFDDLELTPQDVLLDIEEQRDEDRQKPDDPDNS